MNALKKICMFIIPYIGILIYTSCLIVGMEWITRGSLVLVGKWIKEFPHEYLFVTIFVTLLFILFYGLKWRSFLYFTFFASLFLGAFSLVNRVKMALRGDPLIPADLTLLSEAKNMMSFLDGIEWWKIVIGLMVFLLVIGGVLFAIHKIPQEKEKPPHRVIFAICAALMMFGIYYEEVEADYSEIRAKYGIKTIDYNQNQNYE